MNKNTVAVYVEDPGIAFRNYRNLKDFPPLSPTCTMNLTECFTGQDYTEGHQDGQHWSPPRPRGIRKMQRKAPVAAAEVPAQDVQQASSQGTYFIYFFIQV